MNDSLEKVYQLFADLPEGVHLVFAMWGLMFVLRIIDAGFYNNFLGLKYGFYGRKS